ncbi:response regulator [Uliginosibacterium sp. 31-12]|uniref:response regulator n=1 Tax=Uliginosibacterium sp. 31-12 TaxID=3062781 RepID=UPI0026E319F6|nr:response regulator [Uliginosibacterium sp. 31-12]MDO6387120.1 DUF3369 domain-containing protein [Uliginosibacterium sp. 31-12]
MRIIKDAIQFEAERATPASPTAKPLYTWKLLVVDDEPDVRAVTRLGLRNFTFAERPLEFIEASSASEALQRLAEHPDIAVALVDVVMETEDAGLRLVEKIRNELGNKLIRLVIRTGQPGAAPERYVIDHYDIDDYKDKTELTTTRLYTTVRSALKSYRDLCAIDINRLGLERLLQAAPDIYRLANVSLQEFFSGVLTQVVGLCHLSPDSFISTIEGVIATVESGEQAVHAGTAPFIASGRFLAIHEQCRKAVLAGQDPTDLPGNAFIIPIVIHGQAEGYIYIEPTLPLSDDDKRLIRLTAQQSAQSLENLRLHIDLANAFRYAIDMLAEIAEFKDKTTGRHIERIATYTEKVALAMGCSRAEAEHMGISSRLHDVGKIGIPDDILGKPGKLDPEEVRIMQHHASIGGSILGHDKALGLARSIATSHHERWDGLGYPAGIRSAELPLAVRIVSVVDVFDALVSHRPYKTPWPLPEARAEILAGRDIQFDPQVVDAFLGLLDQGVFAHMIAEASLPPEG